jgi:hypothetical protein
VRSVERDHAALAVLVEIGDAATERVDTACGFWLGAMVEAMNDQVDCMTRGCTPICWHRGTLAPVGSLRIANWRR